MNVIKYDVGIWKAEASVEDAGDNRRLATISATAHKNGQIARSRHTVVFDHIQGKDEAEEVKSMIKAILAGSH